MEFTFSSSKRLIIVAFLPASVSIILLVSGLLNIKLMTSSVSFLLFLISSSVRLLVPGFAGFPESSSPVPVSDEITFSGVSSSFPSSSPFLASSVSLLGDVSSDSFLASSPLFSVSRVAVSESLFTPSSSSSGIVPSALVLPLSSDSCLSSDVSLRPVSFNLFCFSMIA